MAFYGRWAPYVPVARRRQNAEREIKRRLGKGQNPQPVRISSRAIATTFWGKAWCKHLEAFSDFGNRLPRGRTYARNGSIVDLRISRGRIKAMVAGSHVYDIDIRVDPLPGPRWKSVVADCGSSVGSILDLMRGKLSTGVIERLTDAQTGLFPRPGEIKMQCDCPDWADLCKHLAAVLYGIGNRLDSQPELLFLLRGVDQKDLISGAIENAGAGAAMGLDAASDLQGQDLGEMFGIELESAPAAATRVKVAKKKANRKAVKKKSAGVKTVKKKAAKKKVAKKKVVKKKSVKKKLVENKAATKKGAKKKATKKKAVKKKASSPKKAKKRRPKPSSGGGIGDLRISF